MSIVQALQLFQQEQISFARLIRHIVQQDTWFLPAKDGQPILRQSKAKRFLSFYSCADFLQQEDLYGNDAFEIEVLEKSGYWIAEHLPEADAIVIDPNQEHAMQIPQQYFGQIQQMQQAMQLEFHLQNDMQSAQIKEILLNHPSYFLGIVQDEQGRNNLTLAPDNQNRPLVAVFTAQDCLENFIQAANGMLGNIQMDMLSGIQLFTQLSLLPIEGLVLNCYGPVPPTALRKEFIEQLLQG